MLCVIDSKDLKLGGKHWCRQGVRGAFPPLFADLVDGISYYSCRVVTMLIVT